MTRLWSEPRPKMRPKTRRAARSSRSYRTSDQKDGTSGDVPDDFGTMFRAHDGMNG